MAVQVDALEVAIKSTVKGAGGIKQLSTAMTKLSSTIDKLNGKLPKMDKATIQATTSTKKLAKATKSVEGPLAKIGKGFKSVMKSIGRIAFYRMIRSALRGVTGAFKEGVENLYQWSKAGEDNGKFAESMDKIATAVKYLKNALATLVAPLINSAAPVIDSIIDTIVAGINKINETIAKLRGDDFWYKAVKVPVEFAEGTKEATAAVKDFMMGWDELNVINDSQGSGGGASSTLLDMFDTEKTENPTAGTSLFSTIKARFSNMIDNLKKKWDEWGLSDTIEKFVTEYLPTIINYAATAAIYVAEIVGALTLPALKGTLDLIMDILDLIGGEGSTIGTMMAIAVDSVELIFGPLISLIDTVAGWFGVETEGGSIFSQATDELRRMLKGGLWDEFGQLMKNGVIYIWQQMILPTLKLIFGIGGYLLLWVLKWGDNTNKEISKSAKQGVQNLKDAWTGIGTWFYDKVITPIKNWFLWLKERVINIFTSAKNGALGVWLSVKNWFIEKVVDPIIEAYNTLKDWWTNTFNTNSIKLAIINAFNGITDKLPNWLKGLLGIKPINLKIETTATGSGGGGGSAWTVAAYDNGGVPNTGSLFWAGEAGPELVDQVGGRSTVYNAGQLAQELSVANGNVVGAIYGMRDAVVGAIAAKDTTVRISGGDIGRANAEYQRKRGVYVNTGAFANAY